MEKTKYVKIIGKLKGYGIFSDKTITSIEDDYDWNKENDKVKDHDDLYLEI